jgi:hypothetical protein
MRYFAQDDQKFDFFLKRCAIPFELPCVQRSTRTEKVPKKYGRFIALERHTQRRTLNLCYEMRHYAQHDQIFFFFNVVLSSLNCRGCSVRRALEKYRESTVGWVGEAQHERSNARHSPVELTAVVAERRLGRLLHAVVHVVISHR